MLGYNLLLSREMAMAKIGQDFLYQKNVFTVTVAIQFLLNLFAVYLAVVKPKLRISPKTSVNR